MSPSYLIDIPSIRLMDNELAWAEFAIGCLKSSYFYPQKSWMNLFI